MSEMSDFKAAVQTIEAFVEPIKYLHNHIETLEYEIERMVQEREGLMSQVDDQRRLWNASRHYKRLREYRQRAHAAEHKVEQIEEAWASQKAFNEQWERVASDGIGPNTLNIKYRRRK